MKLSVKQFGAARIAVGGGSWLAPRTASRIFGLGDGGHPLTTRLFGVRDALLGAALLDASPVHRRRALQTGVVCDTVDAVATWRAVRRGDLGVHGALLIGGGAVLFASLGLMALRQEKATPEQAIGAHPVA